MTEAPTTPDIDETVAYEAEAARRAHNVRAWLVDGSGVADSLVLDEVDPLLSKWED